MNAIEIRGLEKRYAGFDLKLDLDLFKINCLNVKMNNCKDAIEHKIK